MHKGDFTSLAAIDLFVLTHWIDDYLGKAEEALQAIKAKQALSENVPPYLFEDYSQHLRHVKNLLAFREKICPTPTQKNTACQEEPKTSEQTSSSVDQEAPIKPMAKTAPLPPKQTNIWRTPTPKRKGMLSNTSSFSSSSSQPSETLEQRIIGAVTSMQKHYPHATERALQRLSPDHQKGMRRRPSTTTFRNTTALISKGTKALPTSSLKSPRPPFR